MEFYQTVTTIPINFVAINGSKVLDFQGEYKTYKNVLENLNKQGFGIYYVPASIKNKSRKKANFKKSKCLWMDQDILGAIEFPFKPTAIVQTSPGKYHYYWRVKDHIENGDQLEALNRSIADAHGGDLAATDRTRLLRCPEFTNPKNGFEVEIVELNPELVYPLKDFVKVYPPVAARLSDPLGGDGDGNGESEFDMESHLMAMMTGEDIHASRVAVSMHLANFNVPKGSTLGLLNSALRIGYNVGNIDKDRYTERMGNNDQIVTTAYSKISDEAKEYLELASDKAQYTTMPEPYGALKDLSEDIKRNMFYENVTTPIPIAFHLLGVFGGGMYAFKGVTATRKRTICMESGAGKDITSQFVDACINEIENPLARHFRGASTFAHTTVHQELVEFRCRSYLVSEAGQSGKSTLGDADHMRAYMLQLLSSKVGRSVAPTATKQMHKERDTTPLTVQNPVISILAESPPESYVELILATDKAISGELSREEIFFPDPTLGEPNWEGFKGPSRNSIEIFTKMAQNFLESGHTSGRDAKNPYHDVACNVEDKFIQFHNDYILKKRNAEAESPLVEACYTRMFEKVKATAMLLAILDGTVEDREPLITTQHMDYSIDYHKALNEGLLSQASSSDGAFVGRQAKCMNVLKQAIEKYPELSRDVNKSENIAKRWVRKGWFSQVFKTGDSVFTSLATSVFNGDHNRARDGIIRQALDEELIYKTSIPNVFQLSKIVKR